MYKMKTRIVQPHTTREAPLLCGCTMCGFREQLALASPARSLAILARPFELHSPLGPPFIFFVYIFCVACPCFLSLCLSFSLSTSICFCSFIFTLPYLLLGYPCSRFLLLFLFWLLSYYPQEMLEQEHLTKVPIRISNKKKKQGQQQARALSRLPTYLFGVHVDACSTKVCT